MTFRAALRVLAVVAVALLVWLFARTLDLGALEHELGGAVLWPLVVAAALHFAVLWNKAASWRIMLAPQHVVPTTRLFRYTIAAFAASAITPARAGEALRLWSLRQHDGVPVADSAAIAVSEKLLDGIAMFLVMAPLPTLLPGLPSWVARAVIIGAVAVAIALCVCSIAASRAGGSERWWSRFFAGMHVLRSPQRAARALARLFAAWLIDVMMVELVLYALDISLPPAAALLVLLTINLAILVPATPAQVGVHEAGAVLGLSLLDVAPERAVGFALLYHAIQIVPLLAVGSLLVMSPIDPGQRTRDATADRGERGRSRS